MDSGRFDLAGWVIVLYDLQQIMDTDDKRVLARTALVLFVVGLTVPFLIALFASEDVAIGFGIISELLALILGILSWKHTFGKIAVVGVSVLLALAGTNYAFYLSARSDAEQQMRSEAQKIAEQGAP